MREDLTDVIGLIYDLKSNEAFIWCLKCAKVYIPDHMMADQMKLGHWFRFDAKFPPSDDGNPIVRAYEKIEKKLDTEIVMGKYVKVKTVVAYDPNSSVDDYFGVRAGKEIVWSLDFGGVLDLHSKYRSIAKSDCLYDCWVTRGDSSETRMEWQICEIIGISADQGRLDHAPWRRKNIEQFSSQNDDTPVSNGGNRQIASPSYIEKDVEILVYGRLNSQVSSQVFFGWTVDFGAVLISDGREANFGDWLTGQLRLAERCETVSCKYVVVSWKRSTRNACPVPVRSHPVTKVPMLLTEVKFPKTTADWNSCRKRDLLAFSSIFHAVQFMTDNIPVKYADKMARVWIYKVKIDLVINKCEWLIHCLDESQSPNVVVTEPENHSKDFAVTEQSAKVSDEPKESVVGLVTYSMPSGHGYVWCPKTNTKCYIPPFLNRLPLATWVRFAYTFDKKSITGEALYRVLGIERIEPLHPTHVRDSQCLVKTRAIFEQKNDGNNDRYCVVGKACDMGTVIDLRRRVPRHLFGKNILVWILKIAAREGYPWSVYKVEYESV